MLVILMVRSLKCQIGNTYCITQKCVNSLNGSIIIYSLSISVVYSFTADYQVPVQIYPNKYVHVRTVHFNLLVLLSCNINNFVTLGVLTVYKILCTGLFIMYSGITKIYYRKTLGHVFMKPVQIEGTTKTIFFPQ